MRRRTSCWSAVGSGAGESAASRAARGIAQDLLLHGLGQPPPLQPLQDGVAESLLQEAALGHGAGLQQVAEAAPLGRGAPGHRRQVVPGPVRVGHAHELAPAGSSRSARQVRPHLDPSVLKQPPEGALQPALAQTAAQGGHLQRTTGAPELGEDPVLRRVRGRRAALRLRQPHGAAGGEAHAGRQGRRQGGAHRRHVVVREPGAQPHHLGADGSLRIDHLGDVADAAGRNPRFGGPVGDDEAGDQALLDGYEHHRPRPDQGAELRGNAVGELPGQGRRQGDLHEAPAHQRASDWLDSVLSGGNPVSGPMGWKSGPRSWYPSSETRKRSVRSGSPRRPSPSSWP